MMLRKLRAVASVIQEIQFNVLSLRPDDRIDYKPANWAALDACFAALARDKPTLKNITVLIESEMSMEDEVYKRRRVEALTKCFPLSREIAIFHVVDFWLRRRQGITSRIIHSV